MTEPPPGEQATGASLRPPIKWLAPAYKIEQNLLRPAKEKGGGQPKMTGPKGGFEAGPSRVLLEGPLVATYRHLKGLGDYSP